MQGLRLKEDTAGKGRGKGGRRGGARGEAGGGGAVSPMCLLKDLEDTTDKSMEGCE